MYTFKVQKVEFEPPIKGEPVKPFAGWVCVGFSDRGFWFSGCDEDSAKDAYAEIEWQAKEADDSIHPHTVQMFRVDPA